MGLWVSTQALPLKSCTRTINRQQQVTLDVVLGPVRGAHFPAEVLVIGLHLADIGTRTCRVSRAGDGGELDFIQVVVPVGSHVPRGAEQPEAEENTVIYNPSRVSFLLHTSAT